MSTQDTIQIRIDSKTKNAAKKTLEGVGLDMSSAVKLFLTNVINRKGVCINPPPPTTASIKPAVKADSANKMIVVIPYSLYKLVISMKCEDSSYK